MQNLDQKVTAQPLYKAFELMHAKKLDEAEKVLAVGLMEAQAERDDMLCGLYHSAFGVLYKLRKEFRKAWKCYEQAEKLIPDDPALKIISSRLLVEYFGQYDTVIRKMDKVIGMVKGNIPFLHQALCLQGVAHVRKGNKKKGVECLAKAMGKSFEGLESAANIDFTLLNELVRKKVEAKACRTYLEAAKVFAVKTKEKALQQVIDRLLTRLASSSTTR